MKVKKLNINIKVENLQKLEFTELKKKAFMSEIKRYDIERKISEQIQRTT
jgi:hypothetical protein